MNDNWTEMEAFLPITIRAIFPSWHAFVVTTELIHLVSIICCVRRFETKLSEIFMSEVLVWISISEASRDVNCIITLITDSVQVTQIFCSVDKKHNKGIRRVKLKIYNDENF